MPSDSEIIHGDAFEELAKLPDNHGHAAVIDYPWEFDASNGTNRFGSEAETTTVKELPYDVAPEERIGDLFEELARVLVEGAWVVCFADDEFQETVRDELRASPLTLRRNWAWGTDHIGMGAYGRVNHYPVPTATNGETERYVRDRGTLYTVGSRETEYPTGKPLDVYREMLAPPVLREGERLLEPFCGSGPGAAVARERGLAYWGCDIKPEAVTQTEERFEQSSMARFQSTVG